MKFWRRKLRLAAVAVTAAVALTAAACSSSSSPSGSTSGSTPVKGGTATVAMQPSVTYSWIFPFYSITNAGVFNDNQFQYLMYRQLYMFGNNTNTSVSVNYPLSPASPPDFTNGGKTLVINMKGWKWSDGETVDAQSLIFFLNMAKAEKANWDAYVPGLLPDNIVSYKATGPNQVTMQLNAAYSSIWYTYNQLAELTPMPLAWDVTSLGAKAGSGGCSTDSAADGWAKCKAVYNFLTAQSKIASTYATSPLWSVVDGPWKLSTFNTDGNVTIVPNKDYSGSPKPTLSAIKFVPFTSDAAEYTALKTGSVDIGYIPTADLAQKPANSYLPSVNPLGSSYNLEPFLDYGIQYSQPNFNNPQVGYLVRQLYIRQAMQYAEDQPGISKDDLARVRDPGRRAGADRADEPVRAGHREGERRPGPVPVRSGQGQVAADQPRLVGGRRRDAMPGPVQVRQGHHQGRAAQDDVRLLDGRGGRHGDVRGDQVRGVAGRHRRHAGRAVVQHDHR